MWELLVPHNIISKYIFFELLKENIIYMIPTEGINFELGKESE